MNSTCVFDQTSTNGNLHVELVYSTHVCNTYVHTCVHIHVYTCQASKKHVTYQSFLNCYISHIPFQPVITHLTIIHSFRTKSKMRKFITCILPYYHTTTSAMWLVKKLNIV